MSYRVTQITQKYSRALYGLVIVDTFEANEVTVMPSNVWRKQKELRRKLHAGRNNNHQNENNENMTLSQREKEQLFGMNTNDFFDLHEMHSKYQHVFQGPYRLLQVR